MRNRFCHLDPENRSVLTPLFSTHRRQRVIVDAVIDQGYGKAIADTEDHPEIALLELDIFTILSGNPQHTLAADLIQTMSETMFIPECKGWKNLMIRTHGKGIERQRRVGITSEGLNIDHLRGLKRHTPAGYAIQWMDPRLVPGHIGAHSAGEFIDHGIGFCALFEGKSVCAAYSYTDSSKAIEIEVFTEPQHRQKGLATATCAALIVHCLECGIEPHWNAANSISVRLAERLGYIQDDVYEALILPVGGDPDATFG